MGKLLKKEDITRFLYKLKQKGELIAPKTGSDKFEKIQEIKEIELGKIPKYGIKKYFLAPKEPIFIYEGQKPISLPNPKERVIFGAQLCELNALKRMDKLFLDQKNIDEQYLRKREATTLIGFNCEKPEKHCFCESMELEKYYDLFFYEMGDYYYIDIGSEKGMKLVSRLKDYDYDPVKIKCTKKLTTKLQLKHFNNKIWDQITKKCLSCGRCNTVCPTCYCFNVNDQTSILQPNKGMRIREWDACQYENFTKVAGGFVFRENRKDRVRHRIYHKLNYFKQRFSKDMCVGCGKCITHCPIGIDMVESVNKIK